MTKTDYPALYQASDQASLAAQQVHLNAVRCQLGVLIVGAGLGMIAIRSTTAAVVAAVVFFVGIAISLLVLVKGYEGVWYRSRAVAESVKTATWRFMMMAEPFGASLDMQGAENAFRALLRRVLEEHTDLASHLSGDVLARDAISGRMREIRLQKLAERKDLYAKNRINEQRRWYAGKADASSRAYRVWQLIFILSQGLAMVAVLLRIAYPKFEFWPVEVLAVFGAAVLTWMQVRRFRELAAAYGLAAHEISLLEGSLQGVNTDAGFSDYVGDAENAFSREHTQWVARKDVRA